MDERVKDILQHSKNHEAMSYAMQVCNCGLRKLLTSAFPSVAGLPKTLPESELVFFSLLQGVQKECSYYSTAMREAVPCG